MNIQNKRQNKLKQALRNREKLFAAWVSYGHPSITETFAKAGFDFIAIDMEHSTINQAEAQRIIAACQAEGVPCLPRPVSHSNDHIKPLLESGADGMLIQMVNNASEVKNLIDDLKYPPIGKRSYGVSRAQGYGFDFHDYIENWNNTSSFIVQIESIEAVNNINEILLFDEIDAVMIGPYDISGSLGVPGQLDHPKVIEASKKVIEACEKFGKSCGTQLNDPNPKNIQSLFDMGYTFAILGSDLFILWKWAEQMKEIIKSIRNQ
jgi:2-dehydro-3-deoxyglucarate aldolase